MKILLVAATKLEIEPLQQYLTERMYLRKQQQIDVLLTGVGSLATVYALTDHEKVKAITVNRISTEENFINQIKEKFSPIVESMEGAAFHYVCLKEDIPFLQIRSVSNMVGERDKSTWLLKESIDLLNDELIRLLHNLTESY